VWLFLSECCLLWPRNNATQRTLKRAEGTCNTENTDLSVLKSFSALSVAGKKFMRLYGKNPILERIKTAPETIQRLYLQKRTDLSAIVREAADRGLVFESVDKAWLIRECGKVHTQGVMAEVEEFKYTPFSEILSACLDGKEVPIFLDGVTDPQNLGAVIRNIACLGGFSIVISEHGSVHVNETVLRVANGGENHIRIAHVPNISEKIRKAKKEGIWIIGAVAGDANDISGTDLNFPLAVVVGAEGGGIRPGLQKQLDSSASLAMRGASLSYNVAVAATLFCYEINRHREHGAGVERK